jgi:ATP-binding cassette subfamily B protein
VWWLVGAVVTLVCVVLLKAISPYFVRKIVNVFVVPQPDIAMAKDVFLQLLGILGVSWLCHRIMDYMIVCFEAKVMCDLDQRSFAALQAQSVRFFENSFSGSLVKYVTRFRNSFETITDSVLSELIQDALILGTAWVVFFVEKPMLALIFSLWVFVFLVLIGVAVRLKYPLDEANSAADTRVGGALADSISNRHTVISFGQERAEQARFNGVVHENYVLRIRSWMAGNILMAIQGVMAVVAELGLIWWLIRGWEQGVVTAGDFIFYQMYVMWVISHLWPFGHTVRRVFQQLADAQEMTDIYHLPPEVKDAPQAHNLKVLEGQIDIHSLTFSYGDPKAKGPPVLRDFSLQIPANQAIGLVGRTGAGKSTMAKLLLRLYDLDSGYIRIDMQDIADVTQESLRQQIAVVPQHPQLFHRTIGENIAFACDKASREEIIEAAKQAYAWEFIEKMPEGLDTIVGERGVKLSGGQSQRIAIARAILSDPRILILDEATSALDSETEKYIQQAIANLLQRRTSIAIAHRLSTLMQMDRIIVIDDGQIIEDGTPDELKNGDGLFSHLWSHQSGGYIE